MSIKEAFAIRREAYNENRSKKDRLWNVINEFEPRSEAFVLKYGFLTLTVPAFCTGIMAQKFFNKSFKLGTKSMIFAYIPTSVLPSIAAAIVHRDLVSEEILTEKDSCQGCKEFKLACFHLVSATLWSYSLSAVTALMIAAMRKTVYIPEMKQQPQELLRIVGQKFKKFRSLGTTLALVNFSYALLITGFESRQFDSIKARLLARLELAQYSKRNRIVTRFDDRGIV